MAIYSIDSYGSDTELLVRGITKTINFAKSSNDFLRRLIFD